MSANQDAKASNNSQVIQSQGNTNIGYSAEDLKGIITCLADQMPKFAAIAEQIVEERLKTFEDKVMKRFEEHETTNSNAFADPDFQYLLGRSQQAFARSGDEIVADILVDLIAQRSIQTQRSRLTLSLNDAVEKSALLTTNEFSELSLCYFLRYTKQINIGNFPTLCNHLRLYAEPFVKEISRTDSSYLYLASQGCASIQITEARMLQILQSLYGGLVSCGADKAAFEAVIGKEISILEHNIIVPCIHNDGNFQVNATDKETLEKKLRLLGMSEKTDVLWQVHASGFMNLEQFVNAAVPFYPAINELISAWDDSNMKSLQLTSVGIAIGYSNLKRLTGFKAELATWIN